MSNIVANMAHAYNQTSGVRENSAHNWGRSLITRGIGRYRGQFSPDIGPTPQLYGKYNHVIVDCWHMFDEAFTPTQTHPKLTYFPGALTDKPKKSTSNSQALAMMAATLTYSLPKELKD